MGLALMLALAAAGCGHTRVIRSQGTLEVALTEYRLDPQSVSTRAGQLTIVVHNYGRLTHSFVLTRGTQQAGSTKPIWPGSTASLTIIVSRGRYVMASTLLADQVLGTYGTLSVR
jgi:hypothetical protein